MEIISVANRTLAGLMQQSVKGISVHEDYMDYYGLTIIENDCFHHVVLAELPDNHGCSLTNAWPDIANQVYASRLKHVPYKSICWYEYYPRESRMGKKPIFDRVLLICDGEQFFAPEWRHLGTESPEFLKFQPYLSELPKLPMQEKA